MRTAINLFVVCGLLLFVSSCTYVPFDTPKESSRAISAEGTRAGRLVSDLTGHDSQILAMAPLFDGNDALGARLRMIETAESSIDLQTFLIKPDLAGSLMWLALYSAAERGVKIRLLFDDVFTTAGDDQIATLNAHPNVEIRVFNPLSRNSTVAVNFLLDFSRVNRRMHNKVTITDGSFAILGGRNIADEYFSIGTQYDFADFDLFVAGKPVQTLSKSFDTYWNDAWSLPFDAIDDGDIVPLSEAYKQFQNRALEQEVAIYDRALGSEYIRQLRNGEVPVYYGRVKIVADDLQKLRTPSGTGPFAVGDAFYNSLGRAENSVIVVTPYFIPEEYGAEYLERLVKKGIDVSIVTNSLASTNHPYTHGHYARYRKRLLRAGANFAEVRASAPPSTEGVETPLTLHTKIALIDETYVFVGSANVDPRSIRQNSEIGMLVRSPSLAKQIKTQLDAAVPIYTYSVSLNDAGKLQWEDTTTKNNPPLSPEPSAGFWRKLVAKVSSWLPIEQQL
ncbi:phospholipase D family protein [Ruegeria atlantica]|nr:phospholipase D family protein [Ruegeria atlantica]